MTGRPAFGVLTGAGTSRTAFVQGGEVLLHQVRAERLPGAQCTGKRSFSLRAPQAFRIGVQPRTSPGKPARGVDGEFTVNYHYTQ